MTIKTFSGAVTLFICTIIVAVFLGFFIGNKASDFLIKENISAVISHESNIHENEITIRNFDPVDTITIGDTWLYDSLKYEVEKFDLQNDMTSCRIFLSRYKDNHESNEEYIIEQTKYTYIKDSIRIDEINQIIGELQKDPRKNSKKLYKIVYKVLYTTNKSESICYIVHQKGMHITNYKPSIDCRFVWVNTLGKSEFEYN